MRTNPFGVRRDLRDMTIPDAVAYVTITVVALLAKVVGYVFGLIAEVAERLADSGFAVRADLLDQAAAQHEDTTPPVPFARPTGSGMRR
ncbi:MAG: hypothetical protein ABIQ18_46825 [Umezawaea sp.]